MNNDDSILFEMTTFEAKKQKAFEEIIKTTWNQEKKKNIGKLEEVTIKIKQNYKLVCLIIQNVVR